MMMGMPDQIRGDQQYLLLTQGQVHGLGIDTVMDSHKRIFTVTIPLHNNSFFRGNANFTETCLDHRSSLFLSVAINGKANECDQ